MASSPFPRNPYIGPRSFQRGERLYGRERELRALFYLLVAERVALLHAPSGAGKTSLVQAALIDLLETERFHVLPLMRVGAEPPQATTANGAERVSNRYLHSAIMALEQPLAPAQRLAPDRLQSISFAAYLQQRPGAVDEYTREVLILDQFEEILTAEPNDLAAKERFFDEVGEALGDPRRFGLFVLREEFLGPLEPFAHYIPGCFESRFRLDLLDQGAAQAAIRFPARDAGVEFTPEAAQRLVDNLRTIQIQRHDGSVEHQLGHYVEPVQLQVVCRQLWDALAAHPRPDLLDELKARYITVRDLGAISDVDHALASYYNQQIRAVASMGVRERLLRDWIERALITSDGLRSQVLRRAEATEGLPDHAITRLIDAHLIREESRLGGRWCELTHDRLIGPIKASNQLWLEEHLHPLQRQAAIWRQQGAPASLLLRDDALARAQDWARENEDELTPEERQFIKASEEAQRQAERRRQAEERELRGARRLQRMTVVAGTLGLLCVALVSAILWQRGRYMRLTFDSAAAGERQAATLVAQAEQVAQKLDMANQTLAQAATAQALGSPVPQAIKSTAQQMIAMATAELATIQAGNTSIAIQQQTAAPVVASAIAANPLIQLEFTQAAATATLLVATEGAIHQTQTAIVKVENTTSGLPDPGRLIDGNNSSPVPEIETPATPVPPIPATEVPKLTSTGETPETTTMAPTSDATDAATTAPTSETPDVSPTAPTSDATDAATTAPTSEMPDAAPTAPMDATP